MCCDTGGVRELRIITYWNQAFESAYSGVALCMFMLGASGHENNEKKETVAASRVLVLMPTPNEQLYENRFIVNARVYHTWHGDLPFGHFNPNVVRARVGTFQEQDAILCPVHEFLSQAFPNQFVPSA